MSADARDATTDPALRSFVPLDAARDFPIQNLPYGAFLRDGDPRVRLGVAIGDAVLDVTRVAEAGLLDAAHPALRAALAAPGLDGVLKAGSAAWRALRARLSLLLRHDVREVHDAGLADAAFVSRDAVEMTLPFAVGDYVDFYSSLEHATNLGKILRPNGDPLTPNWRWLPIGYHGRAGTVVPDGTPVMRPNGQRKGSDDAAPVFGPTRSLDFELELAFVTGDGPPLGTPLPVERAGEHILGVMLLNDWSARDVQAWEYQPLGPFLGKSFATSLSPWVVTLDALEPFRTAAPAQEPPPLPHLATRRDDAYDIALEVALETRAMATAGTRAAVISRTNARGLYWTFAQQLAHAASNGARVRAGDLFGTGTISGPDPASYGSMIELTWRGARPLMLPDGTERAFLADGDTVTIRGWCDAPGRTRIGFGSVRGTVAPAPPLQTDSTFAQQEAAS